MALCLTMIVKNEAHVIQRCLRSVKPFIDSYSISDTGSTDNTMELIREELAGIPGILESDPWQNFGFNRNLAFSRCTGDYVIWIDADEGLECIHDLIEIPPNYDGLDVCVDNGVYQFWQTRIISADPRWQWKGETHETITFDGSAQKQKFEGVRVRDFADSSRRTSGNKLTDDLSILEKAEHTSRNVFYLAQTLSMLGRRAEAIEKYNERVVMGGWQEEVYYSLLSAGKLMALQSYPFDQVAGVLYRAYSFRPSRYEAILSLCELLNAHKHYDECYRLSLLEPKEIHDILFVDSNAPWRIFAEHAIAAHHLGKYDESKDYFQRVEEIAVHWTAPVSFLNLSLAYYQVSQWEKTIEAAHEALGLWPDYALAYNNICAAYNHLGNFAEGKKAAEEALRIDPNNQLAKNNLKWSLDGLSKN